MSQFVAKAFCRLPLIGLVLAAACSTPKTSSIHDLLETCKSDDGPADALCGTLEVYEDREAASGRKIPLKIVVLPAWGMSQNRTRSFSWPAVRAWEPPTWRPE